jgi:Fur family transcriptional regulator, ferric uptake regulator
MHATRQREAILRVLREQNRPLTSEDIHRAGKSHVPSLALATVYRCLRRMTADHQIVAVDYPGQPTRYELTTGDEHAHFICSRCGRVFDIPTPRLANAP